VGTATWEQPCQLRPRRRRPKRRPAGAVGGRRPGSSLARLCRPDQPISRRAAAVFRAEASSGLGQTHPSGPPRRAKAAGRALARQARRCRGSRMRAVRASAVPPPLPSQVASREPIGDPDRAASAPEGLAPSSTPAPGEPWAGAAALMTATQHPRQEGASRGQHSRRPAVVACDLDRRPAAPPSVLSPKRQSREGHSSALSREEAAALPWGETRERAAVLPWDQIRERAAELPGDQTRWLAAVPF